MAQAWLPASSFVRHLLSAELPGSEGPGPCRLKTQTEHEICAANLPPAVHPRQQICSAWKLILSKADESTQDRKAGAAPYLSIYCDHLRHGVTMER